MIEDNTKHPKYTSYQNKSWKDTKDPRQVFHRVHFFLIHSCRIN